jgi:hypothetical protein
MLLCLKKALLHFPRETGITRCSAPPLLKVNEARPNPREAHRPAASRVVGGPRFPYASKLAVWEARQVLLRGIALTLQAKVWAA